MAERPILFNGAMVRAILSGAKTQTRRAVKNISWRDGCNPSFSHATAFQNAGEFRIAGSEEMTLGFRCPFGKPGDRLWVREAFGLQVRHYGGGAGEHIVYKATNPDAVYCKSACGTDYPVKWKPSIHMPRHSCRLVLEITDVRVERLQAISEVDANAEGIEQLNGRFTFNGGMHESLTARTSFMTLWDSTGGMWIENPWVWVIEFKRVEVAGG
ncbi:hypothetical protein ABRP17_016365 [Stenotrophomonas sp. WHRI 8082]|uniref:hypothetical protein n=1 Tax=Stenotrophomonas sp. WHRI 8082 TaxID=3162571 RepID=UPI0032EB15AF